MMWLIFLQITALDAQLGPYVLNPPHGCANFGLCSTNPNPNVTTLNCPSGKCICQAGYTGGKCGTEVPSCQLEPCDNDIHFKCEHTITGRACPCAEGWSGTNCSIIDTDPCLDSPCLNGGVCTSPDNLHAKCTCAAGWLGANCAYKDQCASNPCKNGDCQMVQANQNYLCKCDTGFYGRDCEGYLYTYNTVDLNYVGCIKYDGDALADDSIYDKNTDPEMTYTMCQSLLASSKNIPPYTTTTLSGDTCYLSYKSGMNNSDTSHKCDGANNWCPGNNVGKGIVENCGEPGKSVKVSTIIPTGPAMLYCSNSTLYVGDRCRTANGGYCVNTYPNGYICLCQAPAYTGSDTTLCSVKPPVCSPSFCLHGGVCITSADQLSYTCDCNGTGYFGPKCDSMKQCDDDICLNGGTCIDKAGGPVCACLPHFTGFDCGTIDICEYGDPCVNGTCTNLGTDIQIWPLCTCDAGYTGKNCDQIRLLCTELQPCNYNSTCIDTFNNYTCECVTGATGYNCEILIDYCHPDVDAKNVPVQSQCNKKDSEAVCISATNETIGTFVCNCSAVWVNELCDLNKIIRDVIMTLYGRMDDTLVEVLNNLLQTPAQISDMVPFLIGTLPLQNRTELSWQINDMFTNAAYEEKQLDLDKDFIKWNDVVLGNCFTFNHYNNSRQYKYRSSKYEGGLRVKLNVNQGEYVPWKDTAAILTFIHFKDDYIQSESIRYNAEPGSEVIFFPYRNEYIRLGNQYGTCIKDVSEVKAFYFPGAYTTDGCLRSCYQDMIQGKCDCMDPRYPMPPGAESCLVSNMTCIDDAVAEEGDPSGWPSCVCPLPCTNTDFEITWSKGGYRSVTPKCLEKTGPALASCQNQTVDTVTVIVNKPQLVFNLFQETPTMDLNQFIGSLGGLLGVLMGVCAMTFIEFSVMAFRIIWALVGCKSKMTEGPKPTKTD